MTPAPMLFSASALNVANSLKETFGRKLKDRALDLARRDGRGMVSHDDILEALDGLDVLSPEPGADEEPDDGN